MGGTGLEPVFMAVEPGGYGFLNRPCVLILDDPPLSLVGMFRPTLKSNRRAPERVSNP